VPLATAPCRSLCDWSAVAAPYEGRSVFACAGCGTEWVRTEGWTPRQADGTVPAAVLAELRRPADAAGSGGS
jgi:hypothetical protein